MIDLQAEADRMAALDWDTLFGLVDTIESSPDDPTPKLVLADWIQEKEMLPWNGEAMRWAAAFDKHPFWGSWPNQKHKIWRFDGTKRNSLPPVFYDGPSVKDNRLGPNLLDFQAAGPPSAWMWFIVRWTQLLEQGVTF